MNWKSKILLVISLISCAALNTLRAQNINGMIRDTLNKPISFATVVLKNSSLIISYTTSDTNGAYSLAVPAKATAPLTIEVTCVGFKKEQKTVSHKNQSLDFQLKAESTQLKTVIVHNGGPQVTVKGDTINYKVSDFSTSNDRVIGDVIKKIPGIEVSSDGKISYNGKSISNFYIDGDNLLDDKYNIATNTIPNVVVDKIQILENHQPIKVLQNRVVSDDVALNLSIKDDAKLKVIGQESVGAGVPDKYFADLDALLLKKKHKAINYLKANNIGDDLGSDVISHNSDDYFKHIDNRTLGSLLSLNAQVIPDIAEDNYLFNQSKIINFNNLVNLKNEVQVKINAYYLVNNQTQTYINNTKVYLPGDTIKYSESQNIHISPNIFHNQITINSNKNDQYFNDNVLMEYSMKDNSSNILSNQEPINEQLTDNISNFSNEFDLIKAIKGKNNVLEVYSYLNYFDEPQNLLAGPSIDEQVFNGSKPYNQLMQYVNTLNWMSNGFISYKIKSNASVFTCKAGSVIQGEHLVSHLLKSEPDNSIITAIDSSTNNLKWLRQKFYLETDYDYIFKRFEAVIKIPFINQIINYSDLPYATDTVIKHAFVNVQALAKLRVGNENNIELNYNYSTDFGSIQDVYKGYILTDYRTLSDNNAPLNETKNQILSLNYVYKKSITLFFYSVGFSYDHSTADDISSSIISDIFQQHTTIPFKNNMNNWIMNGVISKYLFTLHTSLSASLSLQSFSSSQIQNGEILPFNTITRDAIVKTESTISDKFNISYKSEFKFTTNSTDNMSTGGTISQLRQQASLNYIPIQPIIFTVSNDNYLIHSFGTIDADYDFVNAKMRYRAVKKRLEYELDFVNLLNNKSYKSAYLLGNTYSSTVYTLPGRYILAKFTFTI